MAGCRVGGRDGDAQQDRIRPSSASYRTLSDRYDRQIVPAVQDDGSNGGDLDPPRPSLPTKGSAEITASLVADRIQLSRLILI